MWILLLAILLIAGIWVGGWFLAWPLVLEIGLTVLVVLVVAGFFAFQRIRAVRAARALEREILAQAEMQAATARPDRRAEILALQDQMKQGIAALKKSKLAVASGGGALYSLPWYMIVGPPGAGKTTALRHSGLVFPFLDPSQGGIKGLGGTRNCDWWFTNEAVLLDTAGRYTTDEDDRDEWFAFLDMLKRHRSRAPINGMLVAISVADLAGQTEDRIEQTAQILRSRIDEVIARLQMVVPVYVVFTKVDLIAGFVEYWEDLRKSERAQIWGASFEVQRPADFDPAKTFAEEFDLLTEKVHARAISRMRATRRADARAKVLQFPLEFASIKDDLCLFLGTLFQKNAYQETPLLRGAYFTSGTQEGRPLDRVMAGMARAFGLGLDSPDAPAPQAVEPKSYFLTEMFQKVVFPDQHLAARTAVEARRRMLVQAGVGGGAVVLASGIALPGLVGYFNNQEMVSSTTTLAQSTQFVDPADRATLSDRIRTLSDLKGRLDQLDRWDADGADWNHRFGMYTGNTLRPAVRNQFAANMGISFVAPMKRQLEQRLASFHSAGRAGSVSPEIYVRYYNTLKTYLMLTEAEHLDVAWVTPRLGSEWAEYLRVEPADRAPSEELVRKYFELQKAEQIRPWERDEVMVSQARGQLRNTPRILGDYERLMEKVRPGTVPIGRLTVFGATAASQYISSRTGVEVDGVYSRLGWERVRKELESLEKTLAGEVWVLGEGAFDPKKAVSDVRKLYFEKYTFAWEKFIRDLDVSKPANVDEALPELLALTEPEWPYLRLARTVHDNVVLDLTAEEAGMEGSMTDDLKALADRAKALKGGDAGAALSKPHYASPMERQFRQYTSFSVPPAPAKPDDPPIQTSLGQYQNVLSKLVAVLTDHKQKGADARGDIKALETEFQDAYRAVVKLLAEQNTFTRDLLQDLLLKPITLSWASVVHDAAGVSGAFWEISVHRQCQAKLHGSYPFLAQAQRDVSLQDFTEFFRPETGTLWSFYGQNVKAAVEKRGGEFVPLQRFEHRTPYGGAFLSFLKRSDEISRVFFDGDGKTPSVEFSINLHSVSPNVAEVTFEIDGKPHTYKNTPEDWMTVTWPAKEAKVRGAKVRIRGFSGLVEEILNEGDFGLFRLLNRAKVEQGTAGGRPGDARTIVFTWTVESQQAEVKMDLKPARSDHPFRRGFFDNYRCPRVIAEGAR
jgi:type VI secretion system protein ImpL